MATVVNAIGRDDATVPTLAISGGRGNVESPVKQIHFAIRDTDGERTRLVQGWFPLRDVLTEIHATAGDDLREILASLVEEPIS